MSVHSLADLVSAIHGANNPTVLAKELRAFARRDVGEIILASIGPDGADPLTMLTTNEHTLGILYILSARLHSSTPNISAEYVENFCTEMNYEDAQLAPDRVTYLARGIEHAASAGQNVQLAISPLRKLLERYPPCPGFLTASHCIFLRVCVQSESWSQATPILDIPMVDCDKSISDATYLDNLTYHYLGGVIYGVLKRWKEAEQFFETTVSAPGNALSAIQLEALKKLTLIQLIIYGETKSLPRHVPSFVPRQLRQPAYQRFVKAYRSSTANLVSILEKEMLVFSADNNVGLAKQAIRHAPRWIVRKLTNTYLTLSVEEIARAISADPKVSPSPGAVEETNQLILGMLEREEIYGTVSPSPSNPGQTIVTFRDPPPPSHFDPVVMEMLLKNALKQSEELAVSDKELGKDKSYLYKAAKESNSSMHYDEMGEMGDFGGRMGAGMPLDFD